MSKKGRKTKKPWQVEPNSYSGELNPRVVSRPAKPVSKPVVPGAVEVPAESEKTRKEDVFDYPEPVIEEEMKPGYTREYLESLRVKELRVIGRELGVSARTKGQLVSLILKGS